MNDRLPFFGMKIPFTFRSFLHSLLMMLDACSSSVFTDANASFFIFFPIDRWSHCLRFCPIPPRIGIECHNIGNFIFGTSFNVSRCYGKAGRIFFVCEIVQFCNQFFWIPFYQFVEKTPAEYRRVIEVLANEFGQLLFQIFFKCSRFSSISYKRYFGPNQQTFFIT